MTVASGPKVVVPTELRRPHRHVAATRNAVKGLKPGTDGRIDTGRRSGVFRLQLARDNVRRALLLLHALAREAEARGMEVKAVEKDGTGSYSWSGAGIGEGEHFTTVEIHENTDQVPLTEAELEEWRYEHRHAWSYQREPTTKPVANGKLKIVLPERWDSRRRDRPWQRQWSEGPRGPLEDKLDAVLRGLKERVEADIVNAEERARAAEERAREAAIEEKRQQERRIEQARAERLAREAEAWQRASQVREYLAALRERLAELEGEEHRRVEAWCEWGEAYIERTDPVIHPELVDGLKVEQDRWWRPSHGH